MTTKFFFYLPEFPDYHCTLVSEDELTAIKNGNDYRACVYDPEEFDLITDEWGNCEFKSGNEAREALFHDKMIGGDAW